MDEDLLRDNVPMTKFEVRAIAVAMLDIKKGDVLLDIGAGTGSISIQANLLGAEVIAIERDPVAYELIKRNCKKLGGKIKLIFGYALDFLDGINFNKCFLGGSGGKLVELCEKIHANLPAGGIIVANFIKLENQCHFMEFLKSHDYKFHVSLVNVSRLDNKGLLKAENPVFMVRGEKR
ncbi:MAG: precorrin-6Y C5,15-methyltransferase (decarboxylating) subunit CbiT [Candidatus Parvarchaeota archaeon]|nr:precorrin-6Y C5,15-methyltransferase (decarboxylating) subunit CbiT [Candidatus Jingweiarchaeum tengchongense]